MNLAFKPSLRDVLPLELQDTARASLRAHGELTTGTPWFVRVFTGGGAWLTSLFLMIFVGMALTWSEEVGALIIGLVLTGGAIALRRAQSGLFLNQFALSFGLAGQGLFCFGISGLFKDATTAAIICVFEVAVLFFYPDIIQRFLSAIGASLALLFWCHEAVSVVLMDGALVALTALAHELWLRQGELQARKWGEVVTPAVFGLFTVTLCMLKVQIWQPELVQGDLGPLVAVMVTLGLAGVTLYSAWRVLLEVHTAPGGPAGVTLFAALAIIALLTFQASGVIATVGVLMLGFHRRSTVLLGMGVVFILAFGVSYYYTLQITLLAKSLALLGGGLLMLGLRWFVLRRFAANGEVA